MRLKLSLRTASSVDDLLVNADAATTVGQLAERLRAGSLAAGQMVAAGPTLCLRVSQGAAGSRTIAPGVTLADAGVRNGDSVALTNSTAEVTAARLATAVLSVLDGPDRGKYVQLPAGTSFIGRDQECAVRLGDPMVSKRHAKVILSDVVEIVDENSANGVVVNGELVQRAVVRSADEIQLGDTRLSIAMNAVAAGPEVASSHTVAFNRSPRLDPQYRGVELVAPEPPARPEPPRFPIVMLLAPVLMGSIMYSVTHNVMSLLFVALSPMMMVGSYFENRLTMKRASARAASEFRSALRDLAVQLQYVADAERSMRRHEHPSIDEVATGVSSLTPLVWTRRPEHEAFLKIRLGLGTMPSRNTVKMPTRNNTLPELWRELHDVVGKFALIDRVPVVAELRACGNLGVAGPTDISHSLASAVIGNLVGLHSPAELVLAAVCSSASMQRWEWLKWLPHAGSEHSPLAVEHLTAAPTASLALIAALEGLVEARLSAGREQAAQSLPAMVVLVEDDAALERARLVRIAERGPATGVHLIWVGTSLDRIPAACRTYLEVDGSTGEGRAGFVEGGVGVPAMELEPLLNDTAELLARRLSPVVDAGAFLEDQSDLPRSVSFLTLGGLGLAERSDEILELWRGSNSLPPAAGAQRLRRDNTLRALVGQSSADRVYLDLRTQGPHALVGGTTGSGKSEFLQSWILGMATAHAPTRVNFLFVDYKGGAAFADCVHLPHCVGLVTDLSPHLVRRALRSLNAELRRREHVLNRKKAKDLLELERRRDPEAPPSLVIVVDEFAALVGEVPEFVDGVVNVAQRGRSLGLHLILATQRPAGVIKDNLRANTNLRVALRMADESDSDDVIGTKQAAAFDPSLPGRAVAKVGPGRLTAFQSAYVGGHTSATPPAPEIEVFQFRFGQGLEWERPDSSAMGSDGDVGAADIRRIVDTIREASSAATLPAARRPWLPELSVAYRLDQLPSRRTDGELVFGVIDRPDEQAQPVVAFEPDRDGNMVIFGTGGSGKSTTLRTLAIAAGFSQARGGPCHVYAIDFGARGLSMIERLPHVGAVINADDHERVVRLLRQLRSTIDERAERYARVNAATVTEYRERSGNTAEQRIVLLLDNLGAFRQTYELDFQSRAFELLEGIAADGRSVGVHLVTTADQSGALTAGLRSVIQRQLALRLTSDIDYSVLGVPSDVFTEASPPGRGFMDGCEVQVAVIGGEANIAKQAAELDRLVAAMERAGVSEAPKVERLADEVALSSIPQAGESEPVLGIDGESLQPVGFEPNGVFLVAGPARSGRSTTVLTMVESLRRWQPERRIVLLAGRRSMLAGLSVFDRVASRPEDIEMLSNELVEELRDESPNVEHLVVVIESVGEITGTTADDSVQELIKACRSNDRFVIAEGESATLTGWGVVQLVKQGKYGIVLQPNEGDGELLFGTALPRTRRSDFPPGRGMLVRAGRSRRVQVALPS